MKAVCEVYDRHQEATSLRLVHSIQLLELLFAFDFGPGAISSSCSPRPNPDRKACFLYVRVLTPQSKLPLRSILLFIVVAEKKTQIV